MEPRRPRLPPPPPAPRRTPGRGTVLLEFLLVAVILAVGLLGLGSLQVAAERAQGRARTRLAAAALARGALERALLAARRGALEGCAGTGRVGRFTVTLTLVPGPIGTRLCRAEVAWDEGAGPGSRSLGLARLIDG